MKNGANIEAIRQIIYEHLDSLIDNNYCLLDFPNHGNIGDHLIWEGELSFLKRLPYQCNYQSSFAFFNENAIGKQDIILLHGGGNFGDLYRPLQEFKINIVKKFPNNKIIFFPQTVHYNDNNLLEKDIMIFNKHQDLTICVRDFNSYNILKKKLVKASLLLLPDMAFCLDYSSFISQKLNIKKLFLNRTDQELSLSGFKIDCLKKIDIQDWPTYNRSIQNFIYDFVSAIGQKAVLKSFLRPILHPKTGFLPSFVRNGYAHKGMDFINQYSEVYTNRLHGCILAVLLNKKVFLIDNSYGKNSGFYYTWMSSFENVTLLK